MVRINYRNHKTRFGVQDHILRENLILVETKGLFLEKGNLLQEPVISEAVLMIFHKFIFKCGAGELSVKVTEKKLSRN